MQKMQNAPLLCEIFRCIPVRLQRGKPKRVALVSKATTLEGTALGSFIDGYDVVARLNQPFDLPEDQHRDYGSRTDIVYDTMNPDTIRSLNAYWEPSDKKLKSVRLPHLINKHLSKLREDIEFDFVDASFERYMPPRHEDLVTGTLAAMDILTDPDVAELFIAGFDFYTNRKSYTQYAIDKSAAVYREGTARSVVNNIQVHNHGKQAQYFRTYVLSDPRVKLHSATANALKVRIPELDVDAHSAQIETFPDSL